MGYCQNGLERPVTTSILVLGMHLYYLGGIYWAGNQRGGVGAERGNASPSLSLLRGLIVEYTSYPDAVSIKATNTRDE